MNTLRVETDLLIRLNKDGPEPLLLVSKTSIGGDDACSLQMCSPLPTLHNDFLFCQDVANRLESID